MQYLGWYNPIAKEANLNAPAIKKWLSVGAQPSETVGGLPAEMGLRASDSSTSVLVPDAAVPGPSRPRLPNQ